MPDAMSEASLSLIRSRTVRRPISALRCGTWAKTLIGGARKLIPPFAPRHAGLVTRPAWRLTYCQAWVGEAKQGACIPANERVKESHFFVLEGRFLPDSSPCRSPCGEGGWGGEGEKGDDVCERLMGFRSSGVDRRRDCWRAHARAHEPWP